MRAYTISKLAEDAGVSAHVIRDYEVRGLIRPCKCTLNGYRIYDERVLQRLRFVLSGKAAGVSLNALAELCQAMDNCELNDAEQSLLTIQATLDQYQQAIHRFRRDMFRRIDSVNKKDAVGQR